MRHLLAPAVAAPIAIHVCNARAEEVTLIAPGVSVKAKSPEAAKALLTYLSSPEAARVYKEMGVQPGRPPER
jgi:ABC-type Fe3+ transport system substrate-binding protein